MNRLIIIGAGGHGRVAKDIALCCGYQEVLCLDDAVQEGVVGTISDAENYIATADFFVGIGDNLTRERIQNQLKSMDANIVTLIHPSAVIANSVAFGRGVMVAAGVVICPNAVLKDGVVVNTMASIDHDCVVSEYAHISVAAHTCGTVHIGARTTLGAGAVVINNIDIASDVMVGAGAVVVKNITVSGVYKGVPAKMSLKRF